MRIIRLDEQSRKNLLEDLLKRDPNNYTSYETTVQAIVEDVRSRRDQAVFAYTENFDKVRLDPSSIRVIGREIEEAYAQVDPELLTEMRQSMENIRTNHEKQ